MRRTATCLALSISVLLGMSAGADAAAPGPDVRVTKDCLNRPGDPLADPTAQPLSCPAGGYVSAYTLATGQPYTDEVLDECSIARGRQNETAVEVDPRDQRVLVGSSNDYCGVFAHGLSATGPVWLGYYRSEDTGRGWVDSLVPGYPEDTSPFATLADVRTAGSGDPVVAWDRAGRVFLGSESSGDPTGSAKGFGDVWVARYDNPNGPGGATIDDGKRYRGTETVGRGSSAPGLLGKFNDKTAIEVDRTGGRCDGNVYFSWSRFTGGGTSGYNSSVQFSRSTDHGASFSSPHDISQTVHDIQSPDISITHSGTIYVTFRRFADVRGNDLTDAVMVVRSTDCGVTFSKPRVLASFEPYDATDVPEAEEVPSPGASPRDADVAEETRGSNGPPAPAGDCGDFDAHCQSGYTFFRHTTQVRSAADQGDAAHEYVYVVYDPSKPGTEVPSGSTYGSVVSGDLPLAYHRNVGSQEAVYFLRLDGSTGAVEGPMLLDDEAGGHQLFPDIAASQGRLHAIWYDSRNDACYSPARPIGNCADRSTVPSLDVFGTTSSDFGASWAAGTRISDVTTNPNYEQFGGRTTPFAGDYLWVTALGPFAYTMWTDYRDVRAGVDQREGAGDEDGSSADVWQCRSIVDGAWGPDQCPHGGGLDQNVYGDTAP